MVEESVVSSIRQYLDHLQAGGFPVRFGVVFGSQVSGLTHEWSDIDLLVVSPRFDGARDRKDIDSLRIKAAEINNRIEPIPCGEIQWREDDASAIVEIARREGEIIHLQ